MKHPSQYKYNITYLGSIPWTVISSCFDSTMSFVNIALKYGMLAAKTIRCAVNLLSPAYNHKIQLQSIVTK